MTFRGLLLLGQIADGNCCFAPCSQAVSMQAWSSGSLWLGLWSFWLARFGMFFGCELGWLLLVPRLWA